MIANQNVVLIPISAKPDIIHMGIGHHGENPIEQFQINCWTLHLYRYAGKIMVNDSLFNIEPGYLGINPPNAKVEYRYGSTDCKHIFIHFRTNVSGTNVPLKIMENTGSSYNTINKELEEILQLFTSNKLRCEIRLWDFLIYLSEYNFELYPKSDVTKEEIKNTLSFIEQHLGDKTLKVNTIVKHSGISHNHLNRIMLKTTGKTILHYVLSRRMERAIHLITNTTKSIKEISWECGIPDSQHFNKVVRKMYGKSPTRIRGKIVS